MSDERFKDLIHESVIFHRAFEAHLRLASFSDRRKPQPRKAMWRGSDIDSFECSLLSVHCSMLDEIGMTH